MIVIDDDLISNEEKQRLLDLISKDGSEVPWFFNAHTNIADPNSVYALDIGNTVDSFQMVSVVGLGHPLYHLVVPMIRKMAAKNGIEVNNIIRIKMNLIGSRCADDDGYHMPHIDSGDDHKVFLYYLNDSDGDTVFFEERFNGEPVYELNEYKRVSPKMGRAVLFDGSIYHASSSPKNAPFRCIINADFN